MPPKKKGKKGYGNSARSVATVSMPSKPRNAPEQQESDPGLKEETVVREADKVTGERNGAAPETSKQNTDVALHMTPEELERQLRDDELQLIVEKHGENVKKEAIRTVARLKTDRRVIRGQAEPMTPRVWLSEQLQSEILEQVSSDQKEGRKTDTTGKETDVTSPDVSDELLMKLWQLKTILEGLDFLSADIDLAIDSLIKSSGTKGEDPFRKPDVGLNKCLAWLGLNCPVQRLPDFFTFQNAAKQSQLEEEITEQESKVAQLSEAMENEHADKDRTKPVEDDFENDILSEIESDSDTDDPNQMTQRYIQLMTHLHKARPNLTAMTAATKKKKLVPGGLPAKTEPPKVRQVLEKLKDLESDMLFDADQAKAAWMAQRHNMVIEHASNQGKKEKLHKPEVKAGEIKLESTLTDQSSSEDEDGDFIGIGDLMGSIPELGNSAQLRTTKVNDSNLISVRDFGKWTGLSPRRVLEEVCKARDNSVRITFKLVNQGPSKQHMVEIRWSSNQNLSMSCPLEGISFAYTPSYARFEMEKLATPDTTQSEALISTVALFGLFAASSREEKSFMRLPGVWREFYLELRGLSQSAQERADKAYLESLRTLAESALSEIKPTEQLRSQLSTKPVQEERKDSSVNKIFSSDTDQVQDVRALWSSKISSPAFQSMQNIRSALPMWNFKIELLAAIDANQVVIVCGETGCGKSTQTPSFILEHELSHGRDCRIYCTEPRRISAISLARRVSEELGEKRGDLGTKKSLVGYSIRLESKISTETRLVYATTGIVMRMLENSPDLANITHLILDEVHERTIDSDFLLIILRRLLTQRQSLKVVLMSATVNAERFSQYLHGAPVFNVPGRTFPVEVRYLEDAIESTKFGSLESSTQSLASGSNGSSPDDNVSDFEDDTNQTGEGTKNIDLSKYSIATRNVIKDYDEYRINFDLILRLIQVVSTGQEYRNYSKAILIFLPGINEIRRMKDMIHGQAFINDKWQVFALHSTIATEEQELAFKIPPRGVRKIVLATNIAETGITIPDITCVIDTGTHKEMRYDERRQLSRLVEAFISKANAKQRRGRAGRVQNGLCFHLFTRDRHDRLMADQQTPEMMRLSLQDLVLRVKICNFGNIEDTLLEALDAPLPKNIRRAVNYLVDVNALTPDEQLTPLGRQLAKLPLDVFLGKLVLLGTIFKCLDSCLSFAAILSSKSPFSAPMAARSQADQARKSFKKADSDLMTLYNAYCGWRRVCKSQGQSASETDFCRRNCLSSMTLANIEELKGQLASALIDAGFLSKDEKLQASLNRVRSYGRQRHFVEIPQDLTLNDDNETVITSVIAWSFYPKLLAKDGKGWRNISSNQSIVLHPSSVNKTGFNGRYLSFYHLMQSAGKAYNAHETTGVEDFAIALACGDADIKMYAGVIALDSNRVRFALPSWKSIIALSHLRKNISSIMEDAFKHPGRNLSEKQQQWFEFWQRCVDERQRALA